MFCLNKLSLFFIPQRKKRKEKKKAVFFPLNQTISLPIMKLLSHAVRSQTFLYAVCHVKIPLEVFFLSKHDSIFAIIRNIQQPNILLSIYFTLRTTELLLIGRQMGSLTGPELQDTNRQEVCRSSPGTERGNSSCSK